VASNKVEEEVAASLSLVAGHKVEEEAAASLSLAEGISSKLSRCGVIRCSSRRGTMVYKSAVHSKPIRGSNN
jgi:hypothetical protein